MDIELTLTPRPNDASCLFSNVVNYGAKDKKGREIGGQARIQKHEGPGYYLPSYPWSLMLLSARDGEQFGPSWTKATWYATMEEAVEAAKKKMAAKAKKLQSGA